MLNIQSADPTAQLADPYPGFYPQSVAAAMYDAVVRPPLEQETFEASIELAIGEKRGRLARGIPAANRSLVVTKTVANSLDALGEQKWAHRIRQCGQDFWTVGCPNGHGGTVVAAMTKRCGLSCCPVCTRNSSRRLAAEVFRTMKSIVPTKGQRWRFLTVSLRPRATFTQAWNDIKEVRTKLMSWLAKLGGKDAVCAIEFGQKGTPHLHVLYLGPWVVRDTLSRMLVGWTGGRVVELEPDQWVPVGRRLTKRGKQAYRTWTAVGGDWYVDVRNVKDGLAGGVREVTKYLADPFGGGTAGTPQGHAMLVGAARNAAAIAVAGKGSHRVQGYGVLRGVVGRALGKKVKPAQATVAATAGVHSVRHCGCCGAELLIVRKMDKAALAFFNRERVSQLAAGPPPTVH